MSTLHVVMTTHAVYGALSTIWIDRFMYDL